MPPSPQPLAEALGRAAVEHPDRGLTLFDGRARTSTRRSFAELVAAARQSAGRLARLGVAPGAGLVVALPTSWEWFEAWLGALELGARPVAVAPTPAAGFSERLAERMAGVAELVGARLAICGEALGEELASAGFAACETVDPRRLAATRPLEWEARPAVDPEEIAYLQLTSGSTGMPRAVAISHRAAVGHALALDEVAGAPFGRPSREVIDALVSWLPLYHDMGLVGIFYCIMNGVDLTILPSPAFLGRPRRWLEELGSRGTTLTAGPNFGYQLCVERLGAGDLDGLDLTGFRAALTGAEMVRPETLAGFVERFGSAGFEAGSFRPCYGLAEGTLAVTMDRRSGPPRLVPLPAGAGLGTALDRVVSTGPPMPETEVRIHAPDGRELGEGEVGEIRVRGPGLFSGYLNDPEATAEALVDGWLHTGDQGFLDAGELFVTGRVKDLLIVHGSNLMPHELEWLAESATGGGGTLRAAAFSIARGAAGEEAILVAETQISDPEALARLAAEVRSRVGRGLGLPLADVAFVRRGKLPRTTSGKVRRGELRERYLEGRLETLGMC